ENKQSKFHVAKVNLLEYLGHGFNVTHPVKENTHVFLKAYVMLYVVSTFDFQKIPEMKVEWYTETITDTHNNSISTRFIIIKFQVDMISYQIQ
ncbi:32194_t:CDS:2, partial [Racocetra persica]